jgi:hypothetical protein
LPYLTCLSYSSDEAIGEGTKIEVPSSSVSLALKVNPPKQSADKAPVTEVQTKFAAETKVKRRKKDA